MIDVIFDKDIVFDDLVTSLSERQYVCGLVQQDDFSEIIHPHTARIEDKNILRLDFDFKMNTFKQSGKCYKLDCSTKNTKGEEYIRPM